MSDPKLAQLGRELSRHSVALHLRGPKAKFKDSKKLQMNLLAWMRVAFG